MKQREYWVSKVLRGYHWNNGKKPAARKVIADGEAVARNGQRGVGFDVEVVVI